MVAFGTEAVAGNAIGETDPVFLIICPYLEWPQRRYRSLVKVTEQIDRLREAHCLSFVADVLPIASSGGTLRPILHTRYKKQ